MASLGEQITAARKAKGFTQETLAETLNVSRAAVSNWEKDRRLPDTEMMIRLSKLLDYDFINEQPIVPSEIKSIPEESSEAPAVLPDAPSSTSEPDTLKIEDQSHNERKASRMLLWITVAVILLIGGFFGIRALIGPQPQSYKSESGQVYTVEQLQQAAENQADKAYLRIDWTKNHQDQYLMFAFICHEMNGIALDVDRADLIYFKKNSPNAVLIYTGDGFKEAGQTNHIDPNGSWEFSGGLLEEQSKLAFGVGIILYATDENGEKLTFTSYIPFSD